MWHMPCLVPLTSGGTVEKAVPLGKLGVFFSQKEEKPQLHRADQPLLTATPGTESPRPLGRLYSQHLCSGEHCMGRGWGRERVRASPLDTELGQGDPHSELLPEGTQH